MMIGFADQYLVTEKLLELKATKTIIALKFALQALMECPIYWYSDKLIKKVSPISLLIFTSIMSGIKFFLYGIVHSVGFILCASLLQIFTHPLIVLTSKYFIQKTTPKQLQTSSQLVGFAFYFSCAGFVSPLLGHALTKIKDSSFALIVFAFFSIIPFFMSIMMKKRKSCVKVSNGDQNENIFN